MRLEFSIHLDSPIVTIAGTTLTLVALASVTYTLPSPCFGIFWDQSGLADLTLSVVLEWR